jgi:hypothetical protein
MRCARLFQSQYFPLAPNFFLDKSNAVVKMNIPTFLNINVGIFLRGSLNNQPAFPGQGRRIVTPGLAATPEVHI